MRYSLGRALWLSNKPLETTQALDEFQAAILFLKQREPMHHSLIAFEKARNLAQESLILFQEQEHVQHGLTGGLPPPDGRTGEQWQTSSRNSWP